MNPVYLSDIIQKANECNTMAELETAIRKVDQRYRRRDTNNPKTYRTYVMAVGQAYSDLVNRLED